MGFIFKPKSQPLWWALSSHEVSINSEANWFPVWVFFGLTFIIWQGQGMIVTVTVLKVITAIRWGLNFWGSLFCCIWSTLADKELIHSRKKWRGILLFVSLLTYITLQSLNYIQTNKYFQNNNNKIIPIKLASWVLNHHHIEEGSVERFSRFSKTWRAVSQAHSLYRFQR